MDNLLVIKILLVLVCTLGRLGSEPVYALKLEIARAKLPSPRSALEAVYDGHDSVYIIGGWNGNSYQDEISKYSLGPDTLEIIGTGSDICCGATIMSSNGKAVLYFGGWAGSGAASSDVVHFSLSTNATTTNVGKLPSKNYYFSLVWDRARGVAFIFGGHDGSDYLTDIVSFNATSYMADIVAQLPEGRCCGAIVWTNGEAYLFGGEGSASGSLSKDILRFDPISAKVTKLVTKLPHSCYHGVAIFDEVNNMVYFTSENHLMRFNPADESVQVVEASGWPLYLEKSTAVYIPKLKRMYLFGGDGKFQGESEFSMTDKIMYMYMDLEDPDPTTPKGVEQIPV